MFSSLHLFRFVYRPRMPHSPLERKGLQELLHVFESSGKIAACLYGSFVAIELE